MVPVVLTALSCPFQSQNCNEIQALDAQTSCGFWNNRWGRAVGGGANGMLSARDDFASPTHLRWQAERAALADDRALSEAQAELAALHTEHLQVAAGQAAAAVNTVTEAVASDAAHAISWASRRWSAGALTAGAAAESVAVATLLVELGLVERDAAQAAGAVVRAASFVAELVAREEEPATPSAASVSQQASSQ